jgi:hypothetical protein
MGQIFHHLAPATTYYLRSSRDFCVAVVAVAGMRRRDWSVVASNFPRCFVRYARYLKVKRPFISGQLSAQLEKSDDG